MNRCSASLPIRNVQIKSGASWTSLAVQWLRRHVSNAVGAGSIPGQGTKIPHAVQHGQKRKKKKKIEKKKK